MLATGTPSLKHSRHFCPGRRFPRQLPHDVPVARNASKPLSISSLSTLASSWVEGTWGTCVWDRAAVQQKQCLVMKFFVFNQFVFFAVPEPKLMTATPTI